jgi:hypothetical protein
MDMLHQGTTSKSCKTPSSSSPSSVTWISDSINNKRQATDGTPSKVIINKDNRWSNGLPNVIMDDIWSYLTSTELLSDIEQTCRSWNHLSHRCGIGWHTLDLGLGSEWNQTIIRWHVLQSLLNTRIFRRTNVNMNVEGKHGSASTPALQKQPSKRWTIRRIEGGQIGSVKEAIQILHSLDPSSKNDKDKDKDKKGKSKGKKSTDTTSSSRSSSSLVSRPHFESIELTILHLDDADIEPFEKVINFISHQTRLITLSLNFKRDDSHDKDEQDDRSDDDVKKPTPMLIIIPSLPLLTDLSLSADILIKFTIASMPSLQRLSISGEYQFNEKTVLLHSSLNVLWMP